MRIRFSHNRPVDLTARGGVERLLATSRARFGEARMEGDGGSADAGGQGGSNNGAGGNDGGSGTNSGTGSGTGDGSNGDGDRGFPAETPVAEMTAPQQAAYWKHQARKHEATAKSRADYDELKKQAGEAERLRKERETESEKAVREAVEKAAADERAKQTPRLVMAEFKAAAAGRIDGDRLRDLTDDLDLTKYLTDKGEVDEAKVAKKVEAWAPKAAADDKQRRRFPDTGGGNRGGSVSKKGEAGAAEAARRFAKSGSTQQ